MPPRTGAAKRNVASQETQVTLNQLYIETDTIWDFAFGLRRRIAYHRHWHQPDSIQIRAHLTHVESLLRPRAVSRLDKLHTKRGGLLDQQIR